MRQGGTLILTDNPHSKEELLKQRLTIGSIVLFALIFSFQVHGATPELISYQGILLDSEGNPPTAPVNITFAIFDLPSNGTVLWQETQLVEFDENGLFLVILGETNPVTDDIFSDPVRWLSIQVEGDTELIPRKRLVSVAYASHVGTIDGASGGHINGNISVDGDVAININQFVVRATSGVGIGTDTPSSALDVRGEIRSEVGGVDYFMVPQGAIIMWSGLISDIPDGWALCDGNNGTPDLLSRFIFGVPSGENPGAIGGTTQHAHTVDIDPFQSNVPNHAWLGAGSAFPTSFLADYNHWHMVDPPITISSTNAHYPPYYRLAFIMKL